MQEIFTTGYCSPYRGSLFQVQGLFGKTALIREADF